MDSIRKMIDELDIDMSKMDSTQRKNFFDLVGIGDGDCENCDHKAECPENVREVRSDLERMVHWEQNEGLAIASSEHEKASYFVRSTIHAMTILHPMIGILASMDKTGLLLLCDAILNYGVYRGYRRGKEEA